MPKVLGMILSSKEWNAKQSLKRNFGRIYKKISENDFDYAIISLHPELKTAWAIDRFSSDWKDIREQLSGLILSKKYKKETL